MQQVAKTAGFLLLHSLILAAICCHSVPLVGCGNCVSGASGASCILNVAVGLVWTIFGPKSLERGLGGPYRGAEKDRDPLMSA